MFNVKLAQEQHAQRAQVISINRVFHALPAQFIMHNVWNAIQHHAHFALLHRLSVEMEAV